MASPIAQIRGNYRSLAVDVQSKVTAGDIAQEGSVWGMWFSSVDPATSPHSPARSAFVVQCDRLYVKKATGQAWKGGDLIYWNATNKNFTTIATAAALVGYAEHPEAASANMSEIYFDGFMAYLKA